MYQARAQLLGLGHAAAAFRFHGQAIEKLTGAVARQAEEDLARYSRLGGLSLTSSGNPWAESPIVSAEEVRRADEAVDQIRRHVLPGTGALLMRASQETCLPGPGTVAGWADLIEAWAQAAKVGSAFASAIYELDLQATCEAFAAAGRGGAARLLAVLTSSGYRAARARLRAATVGGRKLADRELYSLAVLARDTLHPLLRPAVR